MANMNVKRQLERIESELRKVHEYVRDYHGVSSSEAMQIDNEATGIAQTAAAIAAQARLAAGNRSGIKLVEHVRKALGFHSR